MAQVAVTINGRNYRIACEDGQEDHLIQLAGYLNGKVEELVTAVGQIGDTRLLVMAGLLIADELSDSSTELSDAKADTEQVRDQAVSQAEVALTGQIDLLARRINDIAAALEAS
ncbi:MAG: cell division protein ZapA [Alphaproteobacteria bacterium]